MRKPVKVTRTAGESPSRGREDVPLSEDVQRRIRFWTLASYATLGCAAGAATIWGAPLVILAAVPVAGWAVGRNMRRRAYLALPPPPEKPVQSGAGLDLLNKVKGAQRSLEAMDLNPQIHADLNRTLTSMPERIRALDAAERRCLSALESVGEVVQSSTDHDRVKERLGEISEARDKIGAALDALTLQATRISTDRDLGTAVEQELLAQARALSNTTNDLT